MTDERNESGNEEVEGLGSANDKGLGEYPLDTMMIRNESRTIFDVLRRIEQGNYIMDPDFQRDFIWGPEKQSKLIESVLMRIPLPVFYIAENEDGKMVVVDGLQRLSTFRKFLREGGRLTLPKQGKLNGKRFAELDNKLQNRIEDCNLTLYIIDSKAPDRARLDIFERVNGGEPLTRQQMRNSLYMGPGTRLLREEADRPLFLEATGKSLNRAQMRDREFINRFCGFKLLPLKNYRGDMDLFLSQTLIELNGFDQEDRLRVAHQLQTGLRNNLELFGKYAFRKHPENYSGHRRPINASLWDVMCTGLSTYDENTIKANRKAILSGFYRLLGNEEFNDAISLGTNQANKVKKRFEMANEMFSEVFSDQPA